MIDNQEINARLKESGISVTPVRILVFRCIMASSIPLSLIDIEQLLETVDRSTISRTLNLFRSRHLIHQIDDGSGSMKYEICPESIHTIDDIHVHFRCSKCGQTICLHDMKVPDVILPEGYVKESLNYVVTGKCPKCSSKL